MIYLVSKNKSLFESNLYKESSFLEALSILLPLKQVQFDTETQGLDAHSKALLTIQLGNKENQIVFDWTTLSDSEKLQLKEYFESERLFIGWNLMFDIGFLYKQNIWPKNLWDGMIAEKLLWLGYPAGTREMSLKAAARNYLQYDLDKSVRGKIINEGLTPEVVLYAAGDVMWLEDIKEKQDIELTKQDLHRAVKFECEFIKSLAYFKHCGIYLDPEKWKAKMIKDQDRLIKAKEALDNWVVNWFESQGKDELSKEVEVRYPETAELPEFVKNKMWERTETNVFGIKYFVYKVPVSNAFVYRNLQGSLFDGFDTRLKCAINWASSQQVIQLFELLGIQVKTFDKKTKREKKSIEEKQIAPQANKFDIIPLFLEYQGAAKVVSTYGQNWLDAINKNTGRIHVDFYSIGTDTARVSSGGGQYKLNLMNLPHDEETRACFCATKGNKFISSDYSGQESCITASVSNDPTMIHILETGGDLHSEVARASWPDILSGLSDSEIKHQYKDLRQHAKGIEFAIFYGGDANTIHINKGFDLKDAEKIYNGFMSKFSGIKRYQDYCRKVVMEKGYILMNPITGHRAHIYDWNELSRIQDKFKDPEFWNYYRQMKKEAPSCNTVKEVKHYFQRKSASERQSINYRIQNRGACAFKLASIKLFNWIVQHNYQNIVLMCAPVHDEFDLECPEEMAEEVANVLVQCMISGGKPFCPNVHLGAEAEIADCWKH